MALIVKDRVKESTTTTGAGTITLAGAAEGFQSFSVIGNGNTTYYAIADSTNNEWEVGIGTYTASGTTLSRDTILESSSGGTAINLQAGTKFVFCTQPAEKAVFLDASDNLTIGGNLTVQGTTITVDSATAQTLDLGDNDKIRLGDGDDLQIYHDGTDSYIVDSGTGDLNIRAYDHLRLQNNDGSRSYFVAFDTGASRIYYNGNEKLATTNTGIDVTGTVTADSLTVGGNILRDVDNSSMVISGGTAAATGANAIFYGSTSGNVNDILLRRNNVKFAAFDGATGDISFYDTAGSSQSFHWDAADERLGIGVTDPDSALEVQSSASGVNSVHLSNTNSGGYGAKFVGGGTTATQYVADFRDYSGSSKLRIDGLGNVGIGCSPSDKLEVKGATSAGVIVISSGDTTITGNDVIGQLNFKDYDADAHVGGDQDDVVNIKAIALHESGGASAFDGSANEGYALSFSTSKRPSANAAFTVSEAMRLDANGNLGINTQSPLEVFESVESVAGEATPILASNKNNTAGTAQNVGYDFGLARNSGAFKSQAGRIEVGRDADWTSLDSNIDAYMSFSTYQNNALVEHMRIDSSGNVGIDDTPQSFAKLQVKTDTNKQIAMFSNANGATVGGITDVGGSTILRLAGSPLVMTGGGGSGATHVTVDTSGNVGIGTTSPVAVLTAQNSGSLTLDSNDGDHTGFGLFIKAPTTLNTVNSAIGFGGSGGRKYAAIGLQTYSDGDISGLNFYVQPSSLGSSASLTEAMRIDSSGNLLVGTTDSGSTLIAATSGGGINIDPDGYTAWNRQAVSSNQAHIVFNQTGVDAKYFEFRKDGTTVGIVASRGGVATNLILRTATGQGAGIGGANSGVLPCDEDGLQGDEINLGASGTRWKDLYLSGVNYIGSNIYAIAVQNAEEGVVVDGANGRIYATANAHHDLNRTADGEIIRFRSATVQEGSISVSGTTVSYNGGHLSRWSQLLDNSRDETIVKGTVMTNLDEMAVWSHEAVEAQNAVYDEDGNVVTEAVEAKEAYTEDNEQLNKMAVSSIEGDVNVAGVFVNWDEDDDMNIAMTGDMVIRIAQDTTVQRGNLLMSAGDGTAKPQDDDIVRSKTIAKVTSTHVSHTYDDGSYLVPCVLMAC